MSGSDSVCQLLASALTLLHLRLALVLRQTSSLGGVVTGMACAESSPLPPPPSFSCAYQQEAGDEEDSHRSDATHHASDRQNRRAEQHAHRRRRARLRGEKEGGLTLLVGRVHAGAAAQGAKDLLRLATLGHIEE